LGPFAFLESGGWTNPLGSTNSSGTNLDSRRPARSAPCARRARLSTSRAYPTLSFRLHSLRFQIACKEQNHAANHSRKPPGVKFAVRATPIAVNSRCLGSGGRSCDRFLSLRYCWHSPPRRY
jgi:hypothetical protein